MTQRKYRQVRGKNLKSRRTVTITPETWDILAVVGGGNHSGGIELLARFLKGQDSFRYKRRCTTVQITIDIASDDIPDLIAAAEFREGEDWPVSRLIIAVVRAIQAAQQQEILNDSVADISGK